MSEVKIPDLLEYKTRNPKLKTSDNFNNYDEWYSWLINDWIVNQPDSATLMRIFIKLNFSPAMFIPFIVYNGDLDKYKKFKEQREVTNI
jgi:hypothetical protein